MASGTRMLTSPSQTTVCPNCGSAGEGLYCGSCGQKGGPLNPTFSTFLHDLVHEFAHVDGKIVQSALLLIGRPGFLSREYFLGRRARYVSPIRLYLIFSVVYFAAVAIAPLRGVHLTCTTCPPEARPHVEEAMREALAHWAPRVMFVLVPVFAGLVGLVARRSGRNYPSHLYFAMHVHAAWFLTGAVAALLARAIPHQGFTIAGGAAIYSLVYLALAFHRAYDVGMGRTILRMSVIVGVYLLALIAALLAIVIPVALRSAR